MLRYFEDARVRLTASPIARDRTTGSPGHHVRESVGSCARWWPTRAWTTRSSLSSHGPVYVRTWISRIGGSSFTISYRLQEEQAPACTRRGSP
ncbi:hypothetical protein QJS66_01465 [Kocuria rhizophila]|nr:hypothetical protein QJS66_01465 [Kocuria rhizophila]